jgi:hypothetical protein
LPIELLGELVRNGMIFSCQCPNCGLKYPTEADVNDLLQFAEQFPQEIPLDEIAVERVKSINRRSGGRDLAEKKTRRMVDPDPRGKTRATDAYYEEDDDQQKRTVKRLPAGRLDEDRQQGTLQRFLPGRRR